MHEHCRCAFDVGLTRHSSGPGSCRLAVVLAMLGVASAAVAGEVVPSRPLAGRSERRAKTGELHAPRCGLRPRRHALRICRQEGRGAGVPWHGLPARQCLRPSARRAATGPTARAAWCSWGSTRTPMRPRPPSASRRVHSGIDFPVLKDPRNVVADLALIERTPEVVVLDGRARIRYRGAIDDQYGQETRKPEAEPSLSQGGPRRDPRRYGRSRWRRPRPPAACSTGWRRAKPAASPPRVRPAAA